MPGTNDFKPFSVGGAANVIDQTTYAALTSLLENGFVAGVADSAKVNKVLRQATFGAAALGEIISLHGSDANDDGDLATFVTNLMDAISALSSVVDASTTVKGKIQLATGSEAQDLSSNDKAISPATLASAFKGSNQSLSSSGYQKLPGGLIIQWVTGAAVSSLAAQNALAGSVTLPITFPTAILRTFFSTKYTGSNSGIPLVIESPTGTTASSVSYNVLNAATSGAASCTPVIFAIGY